MISTEDKEKIQDINIMYKWAGENLMEFTEEKFE